MADLDNYLGEAFTVHWQPVFAGTAEWYVDERVAGDKATRWGPIPSKEIAYALIQERREMFAKLISDHSKRMRP